MLLRLFLQWWGVRGYSPVVVIGLLIAMVPLVVEPGL